MKISPRNHQKYSQQFRANLMWSPVARIVGIKANESFTPNLKNLKTYRSR